MLENLSAYPKYAPEGVNVSLKRRARAITAWTPKVEANNGAACR